MKQEINQDWDQGEYLVWRCPDDMVNIDIKKAVAGQIGYEIRASIVSPVVEQVMQTWRILADGVEEEC